MTEPSTTPGADEPVRNPCRACGTSTTPCTGRRGCRHKGTWEWYMVLPVVWQQAGGGNGYLCIGCLEAGIGRRLNRTDFADMPVNDWPSNPWNTDRLRGALLREPPNCPELHSNTRMLGAGQSMQEPSA